MRHVVPWLTVVSVLVLTLPSVAAAGWYLMTASRIEDLDAPLNRWINTEAFDGAKGCETAKTREIKKAEARYIEVSNWPGSSGNTDYTIGKMREFIRLANEALCISTDDPRLAPRTRR